MTGAGSRPTGVDAWFVPCGVDDGAAATTLYVFPHAGAGPASLAALAAACAPRVAVWSVYLPGRQARLHEPARTDLDALVAELVYDLVGRARAPFALFGYCSGALLAHLVAHGLQDAGHPATRLVVGSFAAPDVAAIPRRLHLLPSAAFWQQLPAQGGAPAQLADRVELRPVFEPGLRADFALQAGYRHRPRPPLAAPITVLHGSADTLLTRGGLLGWRRHTRGGMTMHEVDASHWLVDDAPAAVADVIVDALPAGP
jgi:medium-chain acyl-[acyl-carrier-protein] hydrolase